MDWTIIVLFFEGFPLRVIFPSPSGNTFTSEMIKFAFIFLDIFVANTFEELPAIRLINK